MLQLYGIIRLLIGTSIAKAFPMITMSDKEIMKKAGNDNPRQIKYFICERCGYITIVRNSTCPICAKEHIDIKMINAFDYEN